MNTLLSMPPGQLLSTNNSFPMILSSLEILDIVKVSPKDKSNRQTNYDSLCTASQIAKFPWVLSASDGPHVGPMNLAIRDVTVGWANGLPWRRSRDARFQWDNIAYKKI